MENLEKVLQIEEIYNYQIGNRTSQRGTGGASMGMSGMINCLKGYGEYDGYYIKTDKHEYRILIGNEQNCCEDWGHLTSEDEFEPFIGKLKIKCRYVSEKRGTMKYQKKPIVIEAFQYDGDLKGTDGEYYVPDWAVRAFEDETMYYSTLKSDNQPCELFINTLEGTHHVSVGDYVIKGIKGELYPCKPDIFVESYETVK